MKKDIKVSCRIHGECNYALFEQPDKKYRKAVCFQCWADKITDGPEDLTEQIQE